MQKDELVEIADMFMIRFLSPSHLSWTDIRDIKSLEISSEGYNNGSLSFQPTPSTTLDRTNVKVGGSSLEKLFVEM